MVCLSLELVGPWVVLGFSVEDRMVEINETGKKKK